MAIISNKRVNQKIVGSVNISGDVNLDMVLVNKDRLKLFLRDYIDLIKNKYSWIACIGVSLTTITTLLNADFKDYLGISSSDWKTIYTLIFIGSTFFAIYNLIKLFISYIKGELNIDNLIIKIMSKTKTNKTNKEIMVVT